MDSYVRWLEKAATLPYADGDVLAELKEMKDSPLRIEDAFYRSLRFGTGGLRGVMGAGENRMNVYTVARATQGLADYIKYTHRKEQRSIAIAYDSRHKSALFARITAGVLAANGIRAFLYPHLAPTPMLSFAVRHLGCEGGVMITASHNAASYNGYKVYGPDGCQITEEAAEKIEACIASVDLFDGVSYMDEDRARAGKLLLFVGKEVENAYFEAVKAAALWDGGSLKDVSAVYTPLFGTGLLPVTHLLSECGLRELYTVSEQSGPNGDFPGLEAPNPELHGVLSLALLEGHKQGADLILATDPDADRLGVALKDGKGGYRLLNGNELGALLLDDVIRHRRALGRMPKHPVAIKTIVTSELIDVIALKNGVTLKSVLTGFKYIGEYIGELEREGREDDFILGLEESCGYLSGGYVRDKDGVLAALLTACMVARDKAAGVLTVERLDALYADHGYTECVLSSYVMTGEAGEERMRALMERLRKDAPKELGGLRVVSVLDYGEGRDGLPPSNVVKLLLERRCLLVLRPSGTEPKVKAYIFSTAQSPEEAKSAVRAIRADMEKYFL